MHQQPVPPPAMSQGMHSQNPLPNASVPPQDPGQGQGQLQGQGMPPPQMYYYQPQHQHQQQQQQQPPLQPVPDSQVPLFSPPELVPTPAPPLDGNYGSAAAGPVPHSSSSSQQGFYAPLPTPVSQGGAEKEPHPNSGSMASGTRPPDILPLTDHPFIPSSDRNVFMQTGQLNPEEETRAAANQQQQQQQQHQKQQQQQQQQTYQQHQPPPPAQHNYQPFQSQQHSQAQPPMPESSSLGPQGFSAPPPMMVPGGFNNTAQNMVVPPPPMAEYPPPTAHEQQQTPTTDHQPLQPGNSAQGQHQQPPPLMAAHHHHHQYPHQYQVREPIDGGNEQPDSQLQPPQQALPPQQQSPQSSPQHQATPSPVPLQQVGGAYSSSPVPPATSTASTTAAAPGVMEMQQHYHQQHQMYQGQQYQHYQPEPIMSSEDVNALPLDRLVLGQSDQSQQQQQQQQQLPPSSAADAIPSSTEAPPLVHPPSTVQQSPQEALLTSSAPAPQDYWNQPAADGAEQEEDPKSSVPPPPMMHMPSSNTVLAPPPMVVPDGGNNPVPTSLPGEGQSQDPLNFLPSASPLATCGTGVNNDVTRSPSQNQPQQQASNVTNVGDEDEYDLVPPASERAEAVGSDRRDESVMGPPPSGPIPIGRRDVTGADSQTMMITNGGGGGPSVHNPQQSQQQRVIDSELEDRESERSRDSIGGGATLPMDTRRESSGRHHRGGRDDRREHHHRGGHRRRSRSHSADGENSSEDQSNIDSRRRESDSRRRHNNSYVDDSPPNHRRGNERDRDRGGIAGSGGGQRKDSRREYEDNRRRDDRDFRRSYRDDYSYRDRGGDRSYRDYDDGRSEGGRYNYRSSRHGGGGGGGGVDLDRSYYGRESSRPSSRAGSIYEERYFDPQQRYGGGGPRSGDYGYPGYPGYPPSHYNPYGMPPAPYPQPQFPVLDRATMDVFEKHWKHYLANPHLFEQLRTSNPAKYDQLNQYYSICGHQLRLPPIKPGAVPVIAPQVKKEPTAESSGPSSLVLPSTRGGLGDDDDRRPMSRASVHSGQSSEAVDNNVLQQQQQNNSRPTSRQGTDLDQSTIYTDPNADPRYQPTFYSNGFEGQSGGVSSEMQNEHDVDGEKAASRMTPVKFASPHAKGVFGVSGFLAKIDAKSPLDGQSALVEMHSIQAILAEYSQDLQDFPGPLVPGRTHKGEVIQFCQTKILSAQNDKNIRDVDSYTLIWELLILMLRQKNAIDGCDIAELLLKGRDAHTPYEHGPADDTETTTNNSSSQELESLQHSIRHDRTVILTSSQETERVTKKFRDYLLYGHKKEGLEYAMKHGLWGHALFLASKMDERSYSNVMLRFANGLAVNDPLQTLYQSMSGRQPIAVKECAEKNWGDWRPHLAMILSNPSSKEGLNTRSIVTLGDTLLNKGFLYAAHFCYLMAILDFGEYANTNAKLVLIGSDRTLPFDEFATNEAIQCTEIFEYIQKLSNPDYNMMSLQYFKFLYAIRMLDYGLSSSALYYLEQVASSIVKRPGEVLGERLEKTVFLDQVLALCERLKFLDPMYTTREGEISDMGDPDWLVEFRNTVYAYNNNNAYTGYADYSQHQQLGHEEQAQQQMEYDYSGDYYNQQQQQYQQGAEHQEFSEDQPQVNGQIEYDSQSVEPLMMKPIPEEEQAPAENLYQQQHPSTVSSAQSSPVKTVPDEGNFYNPETMASSDATEAATPPPPMMMMPPSSSTSVQQPPPPTPLMTSSPAVPSPASAFQPPAKKLQETSTPSTPLSSKLNNNNTATKKAEAEKKKKAAAPAKSQGPGVLGRILGRFIKQPNQMHLPEDKNAIVWDEEKKRWVDQDADPAEEASQQMAPPKDSDLGGGPAGPPSALGGVAPPPGGMPPAGNKFAVGGLNSRRLTGARVDVFKNSQSAPALAPQDNMLPPLPNASAPPPPSMLFVPGPTPSQPNDNQEHHHQQHHQPHLDQNSNQQPQQPVHNTPSDNSSSSAGAPMMFFNPNQMGGGPGVAAAPATS